MSRNRLALAALSSLLLLGLGAPQALARDDDRGHRDRYGHQQRHEGKREFRAYGQRSERRDYGRRDRDYGRKDDDRRYVRGDYGRYDYGRNYQRGDYRSGYRPGDYRYAPRRVYRPPVVVHRPVVVRSAPYGWAPGRRYDAYYRGPVYVVHDYRHYRLRPPPYGHRWIRDDRGNMLLVAIATGIIVDLILNG